MLKSFLAEASYRKGQYHLLLCQYDKAIQEFNEVILFNPNHAEAYYRKHEAYYFQDKFQEAISALSKSIEIRPNLLSYFNRGCLYRKLEKYKLSIDDFYSCLKICNYHLDIYNNLASSYIRIDQFEEAIKLCEQVIEKIEAIDKQPPDFKEVNPKLGEILALAWQNKAAAYYYKGFPLEAERICLKAIEFGIANNTIYELLNLLREKKS